MTPVYAECVNCHERYVVPDGWTDARPPVCPRCRGEEMLLAALAGRDTRWYWDDAGSGQGSRRRRR